MHSWGDEDFDWDSLYEAVNFIGPYLRRKRLPVRDYKEKWGCYDAKTEVLTSDGWMSFFDIQPYHEIATLSHDGYLEYQKPQAITWEPYIGEMLCIKTRGVDLVVTPNHNLYVARPDVHGGVADCGFKSFPFRLVRADTVMGSPKKFLKGCKWVGASPETLTIPKYFKTWNNVPNSVRTFLAPELVVNADMLLELLGWYTAEGSRDNSGSIFSLNGTDNGVEEQRVVDLIKGCNFPYTVRKNRSSTSVVLNSVQLANYFEQNCGKYAENKRCPDFVKTLSPEKIIRYLTGLYAGDGHRAPTSHKLTTVSKFLSDDVLELLLKAGFCGRVSSRFRAAKKYKGTSITPKHWCYEVNWLTKNEHRTINCHDTKEQIVKKEYTSIYNGHVGCVTVPNNIIYVRRDGKPVWCGNSLRLYTGLGWHQFHDAFYPGYARSQWPSWLWKLDCIYGSKIMRLLNWAVVPLHKYWYRRGYKLAVQKWPHIRKEILCAADFPELLKGL